MTLLTVERIAGPPPSQAPVALLLHGFSQNRRCWGAFADSLAQTHSVWGLDLPGHGTSRFQSASFAEAVDLVVSTTTSLPFAVETLVGYSMGGRMGLGAALSNSAVAERLVLIGATAGLRTAEERSERRIADAHLAARLRREGPQAFLDFWLGQPLFSGLTAQQQGRSERLRLWGCGVPETLELRGTGSMDPLWTQLGGLEIATTVIAGANDHKFSGIGQEMVAGMGPNAIFRSVADAGHACHLEQPDATAAAART